MATFCIGNFVVAAAAALAVAADFYCCRFMQFTAESGATYA